MKVKFTNPRNSKEVLFGEIVEIYNGSFVVQSNYTSWLIDPNSDYNFGFILNEEADRKYAESLNATVAELDALDDEPEFDSAGFSIADRFEDTEEDTHHCDDPGCNCSI